MAGIHDVADVDESLSGAAVDGRTNVAVAEFNFRRFDRGVVDFHRFFRAADGRARGFSVRLERVVVGSQLLILFAGNDALFDEGSISFDLRRPHFSRASSRAMLASACFFSAAVAGEICLRLFETCFKRPRVDREKQLAFLYVRAVGEMKLHDPARYLGLDRDGLARDDFAERVEIARDVLRQRRE